MSDYGRFNRYGLPDSFDNWLTTPPDYDEPEEEDEPVSVHRTALYEVEKNGRATGTVYHFCDDYCLQDYRNHHTELLIDAPTDLAALCSDSVCDWCGVPIQ